MSAFLFLKDPAGARYLAGGLAEAEEGGETGGDAVGEVGRGRRRGVLGVVLGVVLVELRLEPAVDLVLVGPDAGLGRAVEAVDREAEVLLPAAAGADVAAEVGGDLLPGL